MYVIEFLYSFTISIFGIGCNIISTIFFVNLIHSIKKHLKWFSLMKIKHLFRTCTLLKAVDTGNLYESSLGKDRKGLNSKSFTRGRLTASMVVVSQQESRAVARKPRDATAVLFGLKFADDIHYKYKCSQASKARLQSSNHTGTKQNLTQNGDSRSFKVTCFGVSGKATRQ